MKIIKIWRFIFIVVMSISMIGACGGDNEIESGNKIDGVNVIAGKKLLELRIESDTFYNRLPYCYIVEYDTKGRINRISYKLTNSKYDEEKGEYVNEYSGELYEIAFIDYDLKVLKVLKSYTPISIGFDLNEKGYISRIGSCTMKYDEKGYLIGVDAPKGISSLVYDANDLIKASVADLNRGNIFLYYVTYDNINSQGDLIINIRNAEYGGSNFWDFSNVTCLIAYQSGLFGNVAKSFIHLNSKSNTSSIIGYKDDKTNYSLKLSFKYE